VSLLAEHGEDAKLLAGGHSLLPLMKLRLAAPTVLIDLRRIPGLHPDRAPVIVAGATTARSADASVWRPSSGTRISARAATRQLTFLVIPSPFLGLSPSKDLPLRVLPRSSHGGSSSRIPAICCRSER
jgi:hypothetical protein